MGKSAVPSTSAESGERSLDSRLRSWTRVTYSGRRVWGFYLQRLFRNKLHASWAAAKREKECRGDAKRRVSAMWLTKKRVSLDAYACGMRLASEGSRFGAADGLADGLSNPALHWADVAVISTPACT